MIPSNLDWVKAHLFPFDLVSPKFLTKNILGKKSVSEIKWWTPPALLALAHTGQDLKKLASQPRRELHSPLRRPN